MSRTITALFDTRADADAGAERLRQAGIAADHVSVHDRDTHQTSGPRSTAGDRGMWASIRNVFVPDEDRHAYEEGIRRGGFVLTADVKDEATGAAVKALEEVDTVDLDARAAQWRSEGWEGSPSAGDLDDSDEAIAYGSREADVGGDRYRSYVPGTR